MAEKENDKYNILDDIDSVFKASDIVVLLRKMHANAEQSIIENTRADGIAKKGKAMAVMAACGYKSAAESCLNRITAELRKRICGNDIVT